MPAAASRHEADRHRDRAAGLRLDDDDGDGDLRRRRADADGRQPVPGRRLPDGQRERHLRGRGARGGRERRHRVVEEAVSQVEGVKSITSSRAPGRGPRHRRVRHLARHRPGACRTCRTAVAPDPRSCPRRRAADRVQVQPRGSADHVGRPVRAVPAGSCSPTPRATGCRSGCRRSPAWARSSWAATSSATSASGSTPTSSPPTSSPSST